MITADIDPSLWQTFHHNSQLSKYRKHLDDADVLCVMSETYPALSYEEAEEHRQIDLSTMEDGGLYQLFMTRVSAEAFGAGALNFGSVDRLLYAAYGVTSMQTDSFKGHRTVPSAGALYPAEVYFLTNNVLDTARGIWHFNPIMQRAELIDSRSSSVEKLNSAFVQSELIKSSSVLIIITMAFERLTFKYGSRGYRFALIEAGHIAQNVILMAAQLGFSSVTLGGLYENVADQILGIDGLGHSTVYALAIGTQA